MEQEDYLGTANAQPAKTIRQNNKQPVSHVDPQDTVRTRGNMLHQRVHPPSEEAHLPTCYLLQMPTLWRPSRFVPSGCP